MTDKELENKLRDYLESAKTTTPAVKETDKNLSKIRSEADAATYLVRLEHQ